MVTWSNYWLIPTWMVLGRKPQPVLTCLSFVCHKALLSLALAPGLMGTRSSLDEQAYLLLTEAERQTMNYYIQEYQSGHIGVEPLAMALFELFNTHAKVNLEITNRGGRAWIPAEHHQNAA